MVTRETDWPVPDRPLLELSKHIAAYLLTVPNVPPGVWLTLSFRVLVREDGRTVLIDETLLEDETGRVVEGVTP